MPNWEWISHGDFGRTGTRPPPYDRVTLSTKDAVFAYQCCQEDPAALSVEVLLVARICAKRRDAKHVYSILIKSGTIDKTTHHLDTTKINWRSLVKKFGVISVVIARELLDLLFWWGEELARWSAAEHEKQRFVAAVTEAMPEDEEERAVRILIGLQTINDMKMLLPSRRNDGSGVAMNREEPIAPASDEAHGAELEASERPPVYFRADVSGLLHQASRSREAEDSDLPAYSPAVLGSSMTAVSENNSEAPGLPSLSDAA